MLHLRSRFFPFKISIDSNNEGALKAHISLAVAAMFSSIILKLMFFKPFDSLFSIFFAIMMFKIFQFSRQRLDGTNLTVESKFSLAPDFILLAMAMAVVSMLMRALM